VSFDPGDPALIADPHPFYARLREADPVHRLAGHDLWMVTRYEDAARILREPAVFSSRIGMSPDFAAPGSAGTGIDYRFGGPGVRVLVATDPPEHQVFRHAVAGAFTPSAVRALSDRVRQLAAACVRDLIEHSQDGTADFYTHVAEPLPVLALADLFGIPENMRGEFRSWATTMTSDLDRDEPGTRAIGRGMDMFRFFARQLKSPPAGGRPTLFDSVITAREAGVSDRELLAFCAFLLVAGVETTTNLLTNLLAALIRFPAALRQLRDDAGLVPAAVEEGLRYETPLQILWRGTTAPAELGGRSIPAGARIMVAFGSANRDGREFPEPDEFRLDRDPNPHLGFGSGPHYCLGARLARLEVTAVLRELLAVTTDIDIAGEPVRTSSIVLRGFTSLPVRARAG
jgi:cytochrome P450